MIGGGGARGRAGKGFAAFEYAPGLGLLVDLGAEPDIDQGRVPVALGLHMADDLAFRRIEGHIGLIGGHQPLDLARDIKDELRLIGLRKTDTINGGVVRRGDLDAGLVAIERHRVQIGCRLLG